MSGDRVSLAMVNGEMLEAGSERVVRQGRRSGAEGLTVDRMGGGEGTGRFTPGSEESVRGAVGPEGSELGELPSRYEEGQISLVDLWLLLVRRRFVFITVASGCVLGGLLFAFLPSPKYTFQTTMQIGTIDASLANPLANPRVERQETLIEPPATVVAKLNEAYIPMIMAEQFVGPTERAVFRVSVSNPENSQLVLLRSNGPQSDSELHVGLHGKVSALLLADHDVLVRNRKNSLELQLSETRRRYESLSDEERVLAGRLKRLGTSKALLKKHIGEIQELLSDTASRLERALPEVGDEAQALIFLIVGNEIQQNRARLARLEERLQIDLPQERDHLEKMLADVPRDKAAQKEKIAIIESRLRSIRPTRAIAGPARSQEPVGPRRAVVLMLGVVAGVSLGLFAVFCAEFLAKARAAVAYHNTARTTVRPG